MYKIALLALGLLSVLITKGQGIIGANDHLSDYLRLLEINGISTYTLPLFRTNMTYSSEEDSTNSHIWSEQLSFYTQKKSKRLELSVISPVLRTNYSTKYARSYNDGPTWNGKGLTTSIDAGMKIRWGPVTGIIYPNFSYSQNRPFQLQPNGFIRPEFNYQWDSRIDWVQRFGNESFREFHLGQSSLSVKTGPIEFRFSSENMWLGPSVSNPILMSNNAPGFPNIKIGTPSPIDTKFGDFEIHTFWGRLKESEYFDTNESNDRRYLAGVVFGYRPSFSKFLEGFSFGLSRVLYQIWPDSGLSFSDVFLGFSNFDGSARVTPDGGVTNDDADQMVSLNVRWLFKEVGAEIYFEYARNDFWLNFEDLVAEPDHGGAFVIGMQKTFDHKSSLWRAGFEHISLATTRTTEIRSSHSIYLHTVAQQGYTHRGQLIGSPIGPGSNSQVIKLDRFDPSGKIGFSISRIRFDNDYVFDESERSGEAVPHDVELSFGLEKILFLKNYELLGNLIYSRRMNWHYENDQNVNNLQLLLGIKWHITNKPVLSF